jgi:transposase
MKRQVNFYPDELKLRIVQEYLYTDISKAEIKKKYGIGGNNCISNWICKFGLSKPSSGQKQINQTMSKERKKSSGEEELELKVKRLEKDLEYERLRTEALVTMIDLAEQEFKVPIRKKSGAKQ